VRHNVDKQIDARFGGVSVLAQATTTERAALARRGTELEVGPGAVLLKRGRMANQVILLLAGAARSCGRSSTCHFKPGAVVGDTSARDAVPQTITVETVEPTRLLVQTHQEFAGLAADAPRLADELRVRMSLGRLAAVAGLGSDLLNGELQATGAIAGVIAKA
jgi:CRP-like cAMP-binding protein